MNIPFSYFPVTGTTGVSKIILFVPYFLKKVKQKRKKRKSNGVCRLNKDKFTEISAKNRTL